MSKIIDLTGKQFGNLTVLRRVGSTPKTKAGYVTTTWLCKCALCGGEVVMTKNSITDRINQNCGCVKIRKSKLKHGMSKTPLYQCWQSMKDRCLNPNDAEYKNYGGRGIKVCDEWLGYYGSRNFFDWALANGYKEGLTIDRIDVNGNYEPGNCRWVTKQAQAHNRTDTIWVELDGERMSLAQACAKTGVNYFTAHNRYKSGKTVSELFTKDDFRKNNVPAWVKERRAKKLVGKTP